MNYLKKNWRRLLPNIRLIIALPFVKVDTTITYERMEDFSVEWVGLDVQVWRWRTTFALYWRPLH